MQLLKCFFPTEKGDKHVFFIFLKKNKSAARALSDTSVAFTDNENVEQMKDDFITRGKRLLECFSEWIFLETKENYVQ